MAVIGSDDNKRVVRRSEINGDRNSIGKRHSIHQCSIGIASVVRMVDAATFDDEEIPPPLRR